MNERPSYMTQGEKLFRSMFSGIMPGLSSYDKKYEEMEEERRKLLGLDGLSDAVKAMTHRPEHIPIPAPMKSAGLAGATELAGLPSIDDLGPENVPTGAYDDEEVHLHEQEERARQERALTGFDRQARAAAKAAERLEETNPEAAAGIYGNLLKGGSDMSIEGMRGLDIGQQNANTAQMNAISVADQNEWNRGAAGREEQERIEKNKRDHKENLFVVQASGNKKIMDSYNMEDPEEAAAAAKAARSVMDVKQEQAALALAASEAHFASQQGHEIADKRREEQNYRRIGAFAFDIPQEEVVISSVKELMKDADEDYAWVNGNLDNMDNFMTMIGGAFRREPDGSIAKDNAGNPIKVEEGIEDWLQNGNPAGDAIRDYFVGPGKIRVEEVLGPGGMMDPDKVTVHLDRLLKTFGGTAAMGQIQRLKQMFAKLVIPTIKKQIQDPRFTMTEAQMVMQAASILFTGGAKTNAQVNAQLRNMAAAMYRTMEGATDNAQFNAGYRRLTGVGMDSKKTKIAIDSPAKTEGYWVDKRWRDKQSVISKRNGGYRGYLDSLGEYEEEY